jgi:hypothetical protein
MADSDSRLAPTRCPPDGAMAKRSWSGGIVPRHNLVKVKPFRPMMMGDFDMGTIW